MYQKEHRGGIHRPGEERRLVFAPALEQVIGTLYACAHFVEHIEILVSPERVGVAEQFSAVGGTVVRRGVDESYNLGEAFARNGLQIGVHEHCADAEESGHRWFAGQWAVCDEIAQHALAFYQQGVCDTLVVVYLRSKFVFSSHEEFAERVVILLLAAELPSEADTHIVLYAVRERLEYTVDSLAEYRVESHAAAAQIQVKQGYFPAELYQFIEDGIGIQQVGAKIFSYGIK